MSASFTFGELDGSRSDRAARFLALCERAEVDATLSADIQADIWEKFVFISAYSGLNAAVRLPIGDIRSTPESWAMYRQLLEEVTAVGKAEGISLDEDIVETMLQATNGLQADANSSFHYDLTHGKPMELDAFQGEVIRRAEEHGIEVPRHEAVYAILRPWAVRNRQRNEPIFPDQ